MFGDSPTRQYYGSGITLHPGEWPDNFRFFLLALIFLVA
jgi:hypothetical protein